jgi:DNA (cytosine-5)-methyltransferase 1
LHGHSEPSQSQGKETPSDASRGIGADDIKPSIAYTMQDREGKAGGGKGALIAEELSDYNQGKHAKFKIGVDMDGKAFSHIAKGPGAVCYWDGGQVAGTLTANNASGCQRMPDKENFNCVIQENAVAHCIGNGQVNDAVQTEKEICKTLNCMVDPMKVCVAVDARNGLENDVNDALQSNMAHSLNGNNVIRTKYIVRRLTPLECERLQGYPDGWTDIGEWTDSKGKVHKTSDAARYKALGNSIALPPWKWVLKRLCACYERDATLGSLFDGISGFCLLWTQLNGPNSVKFTSEIEDFPIAVCKKHFGDEETGEEGDFYEAILGRNQTKNV